MSTSDPRPIWYLAHPKHQYVEDVQQIAIDNGWRILDIKYDAGDGVTGPTVTVDPAYTAAHTNPPAPIGYGDIADPGSPDLTAIQSQITTLNSKAASDETRLDTLEAGGGGGTDTVARAAATQAQTEVDAAEVALAQAVARLDALEALPPAEVDQAELDQAVADAAAARTALANAQATADAAQDTSLADHVSDTDKHTTAAEKADFHKPLTLSTALAASGATISPTQELDLPAAAAPETKDTTPTAGSTVAVTSEGIKTALDLKADQTALDAQELKQDTHETDADVHVTALQKADFHKPLTLKAGSAGALVDQELDIPEARDKGFYTSEAGLTAVTSNSIVNGSIATIGAQLWVYDSTSTATADSTTLIPDDEPAAGRWITKSNPDNADIVEDSEIVLIDLEPSNNQVCAFSTGENWAEIKANYENLRFDFNISDSGRNLIVPHTITITPAMLEQMLPVSGFSLFNDQGVAIDLNTLSNDDRSFVYRQSSGDSPAGGRMQFKVVGLKKTKNIVGIPVANLDVAAGTYELRKNEDGTFELI